MTVVSDVVERRRVAALTAQEVVRHPPRSRELAPIVELAAQLCGATRALVEVHTEMESHPLATVGFSAGVSPRTESLTAGLLVQERALIVVDDARLDPELSSNPWVNGERGAARFLAAHKLLTSTGEAIGTLCVFDEHPRPHALHTTQLVALATLAERVVDVLELTIRTRELARSLSEIETVRTELARSNDRLSSFAGQVSHDLKTPLTTLSLSLALIRQQLLEGERGVDAVPLLDRAINGSARMSDLIDDVLDYAKLGGTLRTSEVDLNRVMEEVAQDLESELDGSGLEVDPLPTVLGDESQLRAVLQNLVSNAAKFRAEDRPSRISVSARAVQRAWRIEVADNGCGVPLDQRRRVFEPLALIDDTVGGCGIGLATCRRIIRAHGGSIGIDPGALEGSKFWFEIPA